MTGAAPDVRDPDAPRGAGEGARLDAELVALMEQRITFNRVLGLRVQALRPRLRVALPMRAELVGHFHYGRLHGGAISATLDTLGGGALMVAMAERHPAETPEQVMHRFGRLGTIDLRVDYLRPGLGAVFVADAEVLRLGGRVGTTQMWMHDDQQRLVATAIGSYIVS